MQYWPLCGSIYLELRQEAFTTTNFLRNVSELLCVGVLLTESLLVGTSRAARARPSSRAGPTADTNIEFVVPFIRLPPWSLSPWVICVTLVYLERRSREIWAVRFTVVPHCCRGLVKFSFRWVSDVISSVLSESTCEQMSETSQNQQSFNIPQDHFVFQFGKPIHLF